MKKSISDLWTLVKIIFLLPYFLWQMGILLINLALEQWLRRDE